MDPEDRIIARGRNRTNERRNATCHAEFEAIAAVPPHLGADFAQLRLYVTVEPCIMCAAALRRLRLCRVYFGCYNERFGGCGSIIPVHREYILPAVDPILQVVVVRRFRKPCIELLRRFYMRENERAPVPRKKAKRQLKPVESSDGEAE